MLQKSPLHFLTFSLVLILAFSPISTMGSGHKNSSAIVKNGDLAQTITAGITILESTQAGMVVELAAPTFDLQENRSDLGACNQISISGWGSSMHPGDPEVPFRGVLIGIPQASKPSIEILNYEPVNIIPDFSLCPVPSPAVELDESIGTQSLQEKILVNPDSYGDSQYLPGKYADLGEAGNLRSQKVIQLRLQPFQYNPVTKTLTYTKLLRVKVNYNNPVENIPSKVVNEGLFEDVLKNLVVNYQQAMIWRTDSLHMSAAPHITQPAYKLAIIQDGMVKVTYEFLQSAGLPVDSIDPRTFHLTNKGDDVAIALEGEEDGIFASGDYFIFYGQKEETKFTNTNIYWLTWGGTPGLTMTNSNGVPSDGLIPSSFHAVVHREENKAYMSNLPSGASNDFWYWELINTGVPTYKTYSVTLTNVSNEIGVAHVRGLIKGFAANPQHHTHIYINNNLILEKSWPANDQLSFDVEVPQNYLVEGSNTIKVECPMTDGVIQDAMFINWFEVDYLKNYQADGPQTKIVGENTGALKFEIPGFTDENLLVWDITDTVHPMTISNALIEETGTSYTLTFQQNITMRRQYLIEPAEEMSLPSAITVAQGEDLWNSANGADYIMISHPNFITSIQPLADYYTAKGLRVKVVNVFDIYDDFNYGIFDPEAIRNFLAYTQSNWIKPSPAYVLLVGDGNYDFLNFLGKNQPNYIPPYLVNVDPWLGEIAADNRYVDINGSDLLPDMAIGRFPVNSDLETKYIVDKVLAYKNATQGDWIKEFSFIAGKNDPTSGDFPGLSDGIASLIPSSQEIEIEKIYYQLTHPDTPSTQQAIVNAFNDGRMIIHYAGHSTPSGWYGDPNDPNNSVLFNTSSIASINNADTLPFLISMTCLVGNFNNPWIKPLDENLIISQEKGTIASWSPTGKGLTSGHDLLDQGLIDAIYSKNITDLGRATTMAKYFLFANSSGSLDLLDTFVLLGDPALQLPIKIKVFIPLVTK